MSEKFQKQGAPASVHRVMHDLLNDPKYKKFGFYKLQAVQRIYLEKLKLDAGEITKEEFSRRNVEIYRERDEYCAWLKSERLKKETA